MKTTLALFGTLLAAFAAAPGAATAAPLTHGVVTQTTLSAGEFELMANGGVDSLRFLVRREAVETAPGVYDWGEVDGVVGGASTAGVDLLPIVYGSPPWVHPVEAHPPIDTAADRAGWRAFLTALIARYGPGGAFWAEASVPERPLRHWQLWNEPNFVTYWHPRPDPREFARLVAASARAIRAADPGAEIMLGGVAPIHAGIPWWDFLDSFYRAPGVRRDFDLVALHPYSPGIRVLGEQARLMRRVMRAGGDARTPLAITELGWASDGDPRARLVVGEARQARLLARAYDYLDARRRRWRISEVDWYAWRDTSVIEAFCGFCEHAGLFDAAGEPKPAWPAFQRAAR